MTPPNDDDIVNSRSDAASRQLPPLVILDDLAAYLDSIGVGEGPVHLERIGEGHSNITYALSRGGEQLVLRRGPRPPIPPSTHNMIREARVQQALRAHGILVPDIVAVCEDVSVMGVPFYLMRKIDGDVITTVIPHALNQQLARRGVVDAAIDTLAQLHTVPITEPEIATLGRPVGYLDRQLQTFATLWEQGARRAIPDFDIVTERLLSQVPETPHSTVVHGDYRLGNLMFAPAPPSRIVGVLDWEMSTLGDPLADLGYFLAYYSERGEPASVMELSPVTREDGFPDRAYIAQRYSEYTGRALDSLPWYRALALWKASVFCEEIFQRWSRGEQAEGTDFARSLEAGVPDLLRRARSLL